MPGETSKGFLCELLTGLLYDCYSFQAGNMDRMRFGDDGSKSVRGRLKLGIKALAARSGFVRRGFTVEHAAGELEHIVRNLSGFERTYELLCDETSRRLLIELLRFRILGPKHVRLSRNSEEYWRDYNSVDSRFLQERGVSQTSDWALNRYRLPGTGREIVLEAHPLTILNTFVLEMYTCRRTDPPIRVQPGDTVIDAGGCWGDTALYLGDRAGPEGRVHTFEFVDENLEVLRRNLGLNPGLDSRINVVQKALGEESGDRMRYSPAGPGTSLQRNGSCEVSTITIDDFVSAERLERVDFVKMDIEGYELKALRGAEKTLRRLRPKLAISVYHNVDDLAAIPQYLDGLGLGYRFHLDHFTIHQEETVLFAAIGEASCP